MRRRPADLTRETFDLLVVGAGIYGLWTALDASQRGLRVALVDRGDFCGATSSNSLKIAHGGLRYLQQADFGRMRTSIRERRTLLRNAPHLVRPLRCLMPTRRKLLRSRLAMRCALLANDLVGWDRNRGVPAENRLPAGHVVSRAECLRMAPDLDPQGVTGGAVWFDAQMVDTERLALGVWHNAVEAGAVAANYVAIESLRRVERYLTVAGACDTETGDEFEVRAHVVVDARGPWTEGMRLSKAMNLVVDRPLVEEFALAIGHGAQRLLFLVPWRGRTMIGTTHLPHDGTPDDFAVKESDVAAFLAQINATYPAAGLALDDVALVQAGLLPSTGTMKNGDAALQRHHEIRQENGLITIHGVKWTTARVVADEVVERACLMLGRDPGECRTAGTIVPDRGVPDVARAVSDEMALHLDDIVFRRTGLASAGSPGDEVLAACAREAAAELGWDPARTEAELERVRVRFTFGSTPSDATPAAG